MDVRKFGVRGNGTTDDTNRMLYAVTTGEELEIPKGVTVLISGPLITSQTGFSMSGGGVIKLAPASNCTMLRLNNAIYSKITGVEFNGNKANQTSTTPPAIHITNGAYARLTRIHVHDAHGDGVRLENDNGSVLADECNISNSFIFSNDGCGLDLTYTGSFVQPIGDCVIGPSNHINYNGTYGIRVTGGQAHVIQGNNILTNGSHGIYLLGVPGVVYNYIHEISANQIRNNGGSGLYTYASNTMYGGSGIIISNNVFHYNNAANGGSANCDVWDMDLPIISGNYFGDVNFTTRAIVGLQLSRTTQARIIGNVFGPNVSGATSFANSSTYLARGNYGLADN